MSEANDNHTREIWKPIPGFEGRYDVSNLGRVKSLRKQQRKNRWYPERIMQGGLVNGGYRLVKLRKNNLMFQRKVHQLVLEAFVGPRPANCCLCRHLNDVKSDNRLENLAWGTTEDNAADMVAHGRSLKGVKHHKARMTEAGVREMRRLHAMGVPCVVLSKQFDIASGQVSAIVLRRSWKHVA